jgi:hypothetical protein
MDDGMVGPMPAIGAVIIPAGMRAILPAGMRPVVVVVRSVDPVPMTADNMSHQ